MPRGKRRNRFGRTFERVALGAVMGAIALVLERRLLRAVRGRGDASRRNPADANLAVASKDVEHQAGG